MWIKFDKPPTISDLEKIGQQVSERNTARAFVSGLLNGAALICYMVAGFGAILSAPDMVWKSALFAGIILTALSVGAKS